MQDSLKQHVSVAIIGSGFSGIGAAIRLKQRGIEDFLILERADDIGGTWRDNTYPGCACDVESILYSFSFVPNPSWSQMWSPQKEIWEYLKACARRFDLYPHMRLGCSVERVAWDAARKRWNIEHSGGALTADIVISGMGTLVEPLLPKIQGLDTFQGALFHSARWNHSFDLRAKRVAVIGTGASAIQFIPEIQPIVDKLTVFQRTAPWVVPHRNRKLKRWEHRLLRWVPFAERLWRLWIYEYRERVFLKGFLNPKRMEWLEKAATRYLERRVRDPELRRKLTPPYRIGCKRLLLSSAYFPAITKENVEYLTDPIREIRGDSLVFGNGSQSEQRRVDAIILGTGFSLKEPHSANRIVGRGGKTLSEIWQGSPSAFLGTTVAGFPNLFLLLGPNTALGHSSVVMMIESQIAHVVRAIEYLRKHHLSTIEPREEIQRQFVLEVDQAMASTIWKTGGCTSWYLDETGRNSTLWPGSVGAFRRRVRPFRAKDYGFS
jgi:cation diffusion facilitator CzcD-associated flavoprotein CzcO